MVQTSVNMLSKGEGGITLCTAGTSTYSFMSNLAQIAIGLGT